PEPVTEAPLLRQTRGMHMNPGTEPLPLATEEVATANMAAFVDDLANEPCTVTRCERTPAKDHGEGRFAFAVVLDDGQEFEVQMPGIPLERLRGDASSDAFAYHRLYVDGNSWLWAYAVAIVGEKW
ncbi:hypothetical protein, partial [Streptomyces enissocaesilis]|uniref:hypothetical protein n=1 Tax=Streptomyces enissocaesilis TaxID=332589 RepID=UPI0031D54715